MNKLAWIEWYTTDWDSGGLFGQTATNWRLAAEHPQDFDIIRRELGKETRESLELSGEIGYRDIDAAAAAQEYKRAWQAVQEDQWRDETEPDRTDAEQRAIDWVAERRGEEWAEEHAELILAQVDLVGGADDPGLPHNTDQ